MTNAAGTTGTSEIRSGWIPGAVRARPVLLACVALFLFSVTLYLLTMAPGLTWENEGGDGGDFLAAAHTWGIPHPTGYPTYLVLMRLFSEVLWFGDEALHGNIFSAITAAIAVPFFFLASRKMLLRLPLSDTRGRYLPFAAALVTALGFATSNLHWSQATITEVYALNAMFVSMFGWLALVARARMDRGESARNIRLAMAIILGIALGNHVTIVFVAAPLGAWMYWPTLRNSPQHLRQEWLPLAGLIAGLTVYIYAPVASAQDPPLNWFFPDSFSGFSSMASASLYQSYVFGLPAEGIDDRLVSGARLWLTQFTALGAILGLVGVLLLWERMRTLAVATAVSFLGLFIYSIAYNSFDSYVFLVPAFLVFGMWISAGLLNLATTMIAVAERRQSGWLAMRKRWILPTVFAGALIGMPLWSIAFNYEGIDISDDTEAADYVDEAFSVAGDRAVIIAEDIPTFGLWYQSLVADPDRDVAVIATFLLGFDWYWEHIERQFPDRVPDGFENAGALNRTKAIAAHNLGLNPVFITDDEDRFAAEFELLEDGPLWRIEG